MKSLASFLVAILPWLAGTASAQIWNEAGEAGNLPAAAQVPLGFGPLTQLVGNLNDPLEPLGAGNDRDMYWIQIDSPTAFSATTVGGSTLDTQLWLFDKNGRGVSFCDDILTSTQSTLTGQFVVAPGTYLLAISRFDRDATNAGAEIWLDTPFATERAPDGPAAALPIDGWNGLGTTTIVGSYTITLTGASFPGQLVAIDSNRNIYLIDPVAGGKTLIATAALAASTTAGLTFEPLSRTVYVSSTGNDSVFSLDIATGNVNLIGPYGDPAIVMHGLEFESRTGTLYGASSHNAGLYRINQSTGAATLVGTTGLTSFTNIAYDASTQLAYATNSGTDSFYQINLLTGGVSLIGPLTGPTNPNGLAFHGVNGRLYMVDNSTDNLYTIDLSTGLATVIGSTGTGNLLGLVYVPPLSEPVRLPHACGPVQFQVTGSPAPGGTVAFTVSGTSGIPLIGLGVAPGYTSFCNCVIGHEFAVIAVGNSTQVTIPNLPAYIGAQLAGQGGDFLSPFGCLAPLQIALSDTIVVRIN